MAVIRININYKKIALLLKKEKQQMSLWSKMSLLRENCIVTKWMLMNVTTLK